MGAPFEAPNGNQALKSKAQAPCHASAVAGAYARSTEESEEVEANVMRSRSFRVASIVAVAVVLTVNLTAPKPAEAFIHEIIAAMCRAGGEEVIPPGQVREGTQSFIRALQASGFITSIDTSDPAKVVINFDPTVPNSKFMSAGFDLTIPDGIAPGVDLVLSPLVVPDPNFPAHAMCHNLR
jgi:hypothetical protein